MYTTMLLKKKIICLTRKIYIIKKNKTKNINILFHSHFSIIPLYCAFRIKAHCKSHLNFMVNLRRT